MKFASLFIGLAYAHMEMLTPMPRRSKNFKSAYQGDANIDYNMSAPLDEVDYTYPCRGYAPGPASAEYTAGQDIPIELHGTANHNGGHCQISLSYDNVNFIVIKTIMGDCMINTLNYSVHLPENTPSGKATLAWTWINRSGNREFYMNCADVNIKGKDNTCLTGKKILIANIDNYPTFPEGFANNYGQALFDAQPVATACGKASYPTIPVPEVPSQASSSSMTSKPSQSASVSSSSVITPSSSSVSKPSSIPANVPSSSPVSLPSSSPVNVPSSSPVNVPSSSPVNVPSSSPVSVPSSSPVNVPSSSPANVPSSSPANVPSSSPANLPSSSQNNTPSSSPISVPVSSSSATAQPTKKPAHCRPRSTSGMPIIPSSSINYPSSTGVSSSVSAPASKVSASVSSNVSVTASSIPASASSSVPTSSNTNKPSKCHHKSTATASVPSTISHPVSSQTPATSVYASESQSISKPSPNSSATLVTPTSMPVTYPTSQPESSNCVDNTMKCMGPNAIAKCYFNTQYIHACPLGTTCQFLAGYDRCI